MTDTADVDIEALVGSIRFRLRFRVEAARHHRHLGPCVIHIN